MVNEKERFEILLEHIVTKIDAVAEGHEILLNNIHSVRHELKETKDELNEKIMWSNNALHEKIDNVKVELNEKIDNVEIRLNNKIDSVKAEVAEVRVELNGKIDNVKIELKQDINEVKKGVNRIDGKLTHVLERQDMQEEKLEKVYKKVFVG